MNLEGGFVIATNRVEPVEKFLSPGCLREARATLHSEDFGPIRGITDMCISVLGEACGPMGEPIIKGNSRRWDRVKHFTAVTSDGACQSQSSAGRAIQGISAHRANARSRDDTASDFRVIRFLDDVDFLSTSSIYRPQRFYEAPVAALSAAPRIFLNPLKARGERLPSPTL